TVLLLVQLIGAGAHRAAPNPATKLLEIRRALYAHSNLVGDSEPASFEQVENDGGGHGDLTFELSLKPALELSFKPALEPAFKLALELSLFESGSLELVVLWKHFERLSSCVAKSSLNEVEV